MADVQETKNALWRRDEQLRRWNISETNNVSAEPRTCDTIKVKFEDSYVFLAACSSGDKEEVEKLLRKGADINTPNIDGLTALHQACIDDKLDMVKFLIDHGADINATDNEGWSSLHATASCGFLEVARYLIQQGADIAMVNNDGELAIDLAESDEMEDLLDHAMDEKGIDADAARGEEEKTMMQDANKWLNGQYDEVPHPKTGATALHCAASKGYINVMKLLLQVGADIDAVDLDGWTSLHAAAHWGMEDSCQVLVENFCNMDILNNAGQTALDVVDPEIEDFLKKLQQQQVSLRQVKEESHIDILHRGAISGKRRSSVTRMSVDQKQNMGKSNAEDEREIMRNKVVEEDRKSSSSEAEDTATSSTTESSSDSETEKKNNEINRQQTNTHKQVNGTTAITVPESPREKEKPKLEAPTSKIEDAHDLKPPPPKPDPPSTLTPRIQDLVKVDRLQKEDDKENERLNERTTNRTSFIRKIHPDNQKKDDLQKDDIIGKKSDKIGELENGRGRSTLPGDTDNKSRYDMAVRVGSGLFTGTAYTAPRTSNTTSASLANITATPSTSASTSAISSSASTTTISSSSLTTLPSSVTTSTTSLSSSYLYTPFAPLSRRRQLEDDTRQDRHSIAGSVPTTSPTSTTNTATGVTGRRSYAPPVRDEEREAERKARARRARETRRSTQGVTRADLEMAEKELKAAGDIKASTDTSHTVSGSVYDRSDKENKPDVTSTLLRRPPRSGEDKPSTDDSSSYRKYNRDSALTSDSYNISSSYSRGARASSLTVTTSNSISTTTTPLSTTRLSSTPATLTAATTTTTVSSTTSSLTPYSRTYHSKYLKPDDDESAKKDDVKVDDKNKDADNDSPSQKSSAIRRKVKREHRKLTGKVSLEDVQQAAKNTDDKESENPETPTEETTRYGSRYSDLPGSSLYDASRSSSGRDRPSSYHAQSGYSRSRSSTSLPDKDIDYKKLYEEQKAENEKLRREFKRTQQELSEAKLDLDKLRMRPEPSRNPETAADRKEKRTLERKISELEEELRQMENLKADNLRLKEENGALIRVISKLSK